MIEVDLSDPDIIVATPRGVLSETDFDGLARAIDTRINETDTVPSLVLHMDALPHLDSIGALSRQFHFIKVHGKVVPKVAVVGDAPLLAIAPEIAGHFVSAKVRRFPANMFDRAKEWARDREDDPGRFEEIGGLPRDVIALRAVGLITAEDYRDMVVPLVEERLKVHDKLKCLIVLDENEATYSGEAVWADMKLGLTHWNSFTRVALVTDIAWMTKAMWLLSPIVPYQMQAFAVADLEAAKSWVKA